jgi:hypothetical protein
MSRKKLALVTLLTLVVFITGMILTSCGASSDYAGEDASYDYVESAPYPGDDYAMTSAEAGDEAVKRVDGGVGEVATRYMIRNGSLDLSVRDTRETIREIRTLIEDTGGIISSSYIYEIKEGQFGAYLTLRVPERLFDQTMQQLETYGKATNVQTGVDDVTMQYVDLESRLNNQIAQEKRLIEILDMADTVEDVLEVERELYRIRGEIESMTAQLTYLKDQVTYSTINLSLREESIPTENISPGAFDDFGSKVMQALIGSINFVLSAVSVILLAIVALLPVMIVLGGLALIIVLLVRKASKRKKTTAHEKPEETDNSQTK